MPGKYAGTSSVPADASRSAIERTLRRYGADSFAYGTDDTLRVAVIGFRMRGRQMRVVLPMPDPKSREFTHTPGRGLERSPQEAEKQYEQATRSSWRRLLLVIQAKLEAVESGIVTFEQEWTMHMVLPDGRTVAEHVVPAVEQAYATGVVPSMLALGPGGDRG